MHPTTVQLSVLPLAMAWATVLGACSGERICTEEERLAVRVHVASPFGLPVDRVTAERDHEMVCAFSATVDDAGTDLMFRCNEQGEGTYTVRAYSGKRVWSAQVHIDANECHTTEIEDVDLVLDPGEVDAVESGAQGQAGHGR
jgi:hypothetical protein